MRKTTAYARKRARQGLPGDPAVGRLSDYVHWQRFVTNSIPYDEDPTNQNDADAIMANHRLLFQKLCDRLLPSQNIEAHDAMTHVVDVARVRVEEIGGDGMGYALEILRRAADAVRRLRSRWETAGCMGARSDALEAITPPHRARNTRAISFMELQCNSVQCAAA